MTKSFIKKKTLERRFRNRDETENEEDEEFTQYL